MHGAGGEGYEREMAMDPDAYGIVPCRSTARMRGGGTAGVRENEREIKREGILRGASGAPS